MELQRGFALFLQQFKALLKKNFLLSWRHKTSTFLQLFSSLFFIFLIFCIDKAARARFSSTTWYENVFDPKPLISPPIPPCEDKFLVKNPCFDFVWSGNGSSRIHLIVNNIMANNPGRPIPSHKVKSFRTSDELNAWLFSDPMRCPGAVHFVDRDDTIISYGIQTNSTPIRKRGMFENPTFKFQIPLQIAAEREIARTLVGDSHFTWEVGFKEFAHPAISSFSVVGTVGPTFFLAIAMFGFVFQIGSMVAEKELKLRQAMSIMGLYESAYWLSWLTWETCISLLSSLFTVLFGMMFQFDFFLHNSFLVLFILFFLFQFNMIGFAFLLSTFIRKSSSATSVGFSTYIIGFLSQLVTTFGFPYSKTFSKTYRVVWSVFPPNVLSKAFDLLGGATGTPEDNGISWNRRAECPHSEIDCLITIDQVFRWLVSTFFVWFLLAIYIDSIIPNSYGMRKSPFYFLKPGYWTGKGGYKGEEGGICSCTKSSAPLEDGIPDDGDDDDVLQEKNAVKGQVSQSAADPNVAVQITGLEKTYSGTTNINCRGCKRTSPYFAVKGLWVNLAKDQTFCLLGPNGAGKTSVINCLTGLTPVTGGDALIYGYSIRSSVDMFSIRRMIGVCPQFDILWDALSGIEHLHLFASIKGLPPPSIESVAARSLAEVKLTDAEKIRTGSYSGGMRRRLSVAIALIGDPKLVILDEPTTGMDPITRRDVWNIIDNAKEGRAVVLTTHSMEEADILGDRIAIMAKGKLRCIGTSIRLKSRFGSGIIVTTSFHGDKNPHTPNGNEGIAGTTEDQRESVKQFFKDHLDVLPKEENKAFLTFVVSQEQEGLLKRFFKELEDRKGEFGVSDIQMGLTSLEEVFLNIAKKAELESALIENRLVTLTLTSGVSLQIPRGARFIGIPGTESTDYPKGLMVEVYWEQDENGDLCISGHSSETPIPDNVQPVASSATTTRTSLFGRTQPVHGILIHPEEIEGSNSQAPK